MKKQTSWNSLNCNLKKISHYDAWPHLHRCWGPLPAPPAAPARMPLAPAGSARRLVSSPSGMACFATGQLTICLFNVAMDNWTITIFNREIQHYESSSNGPYLSIFHSYVSLPKGNYEASPCKISISKSVFTVVMLFSGQCLTIFCQRCPTSSEHAGDSPLGPSPYQKQKWIRSHNKFRK